MSSPSSDLLIARPLRAQETVCPLRDPHGRDRRLLAWSTGADRANGRLCVTMRKAADAGLAELRHRVVRDSAELAQAAHQLARKYREAGDHVAAARWSRVAAAHPESADLLDALIAHYDPIRPAGRIRP